MRTTFVQDLQWRGMLHDSTPGIEEHLMGGMRAAYNGIDPTADAIHVGNLVGLIALRRFQLAGHKPFVLIGGATGMIGDPSERATERSLLDEATLRHNQECIKAQLSRLLDFESDAPNAAVLVNNYDWIKNFSFLEFIRDVGKHITVNYMMAKDSVKKRCTAATTEGMSFTEFTYQLIQGYDFVHLCRNHNCTLQMGGSDQWGNITTGTELIRKMGAGKGFALTWPLITKADGTKFGKTAGGSVWLDAQKTSPYTFYQYWLNASDEDAETYIKIFTFLSREAIEELVAAHRAAPHLRILQKHLAAEVTRMVHSQTDLDNAINASTILFGQATTAALQALEEASFLEVFEGVPQAHVSKDALSEGLDMVAALAAKTGFLASNAEARRALQQNAIAVNKQKVGEDYRITSSDLIHGKFVLLQRGKKNYFLLLAQ